MWSPSDAYEALEECKAAMERHLAGLNDGVTYRREGDTLRRVDGKATFLLKCLPDTIDRRTKK